MYALQITVSNDRYGDNLVWGFRSNCQRYLIETSRGHRDRRHEEPIVLLNPGKPGDVCFLPRPGAFTIDLTGLPADAASVPVTDAQGALMHTLTRDEAGKAAHTFAADAGRGSTPWRLHFPSAQAVVEIDGVTRWASGDAYPDLSLWSPDPASFFALHENRWLLTPYSRTLYTRPGQSGQIVFGVHNNATRERAIRLSLEFPAGEWPVRLSGERVTLGPKQVAEVTAAYTLPRQGGARVCHIRATPEDGSGFTTYSTLSVQAGPAPASRPLPLPWVLRPYEHENEQLGYLPEYPVGWEFYFDLHNRPYMRTDNGLAALRDGRWNVPARPIAVRSDDHDLDRVSLRAEIQTSKIAFDADNGLYLLANASARSVLLHSTDGGNSFTAYSMGKSGGLDLEQFSGHNTPAGPPPVLRSIQTASDPKLFWRRVCDLELFQPRKEGGRLVIGEPILISRNCLGVGSHSGVASAVVSRGTKVHMVWAEATDPAEKVPGVPTYVATYDRETRTLSKPALVGYGAPPNDVHNRPCITMDSRGTLHVLTGTHGQPFYYARSLEPNDAAAGWTEAECVGQGLSQTYIGMVCGPDDTLYVAFRLWQTDPKLHPNGASFATLAMQRKRPGQPWDAPRILVVPPYTEYGVYYHRLTMDRAGRLFLSYDPWSTYWFYRTDYRGSHRALITSADGGETWKMAETADFEARR